MAEKLYSTFWIYSETMGVFGRLCAAEDALVDLEPDARLIPNKPDGDCRFDPTLNEWVPNPAIEPTPEEKRELMPVITKRQLQLTLVRNGISLEQVEATIAAMPDGLPKQEAEIEWNTATEFRRLHPTLLLVAQALNLSDEQVDALWEKAVLA
ncbi:hypothetical protein [Brucella intermedia]|uniref:hypothetical protein n=1 Tax=Brucella intermedia TaxID=94625 RepID=UPI0023601FE5|nr:hypothetical protein [Brucella intermedia]